MRLPHSSTGTLSGVCIRWCEAIPTLVGGSGAKCGGGEVGDDITREQWDSTVNAGDFILKKCDSVQYYYRVENWTPKTLH